MPFPPQPAEPLVTRRLELRPLERTDLDELWEIHRDPRTFDHDSTPVVRDVERMHRVLCTWIADREDQGFGYAAVRLRADGAGAPIIGVCGLTRYELAGRTVLSAYYRFRPETWGRGIATEAMRAVLERASRVLPGAETAIITDRDNVPSCALARRLGYAETRDAVPGEPQRLVLTRRLDEGAPA